MNDIQKEINQVVSELDLSKPYKDVLIEMATDPHGLPKETAYSMIPRLTGVANDFENQKIITDLVGREFLTIVKEGKREYLRANYKKLNISIETISRLKGINMLGFEIIGQPHSPKGMQTLEELLINEKEEIYIATGITSYDTFEALEKRANAGFKTIFLFPHKKHVTTTNIEHYKLVLKNWREFLNGSSKKVKKNIVFRIVNSSFEPLYTTLLSQSFVRVNIRTLNCESTRNGTLIFVGNSTSLYKILEMLYSNIFLDSLPDWSIHPFLYLKELSWKYKNGLIVTIIALLMLMFSKPISTFAQGILIKIIYDLIIKLMRSNKWKKKELYQK